MKPSKKFNLLAFALFVLLLILSIFSLCYSDALVGYAKKSIIYRSVSKSDRQPDYSKPVFLTEVETENQPVSVWGNDRLCTEFVMNNFSLLARLIHPCKISSAIYCEYCPSHYAYFGYSRDFWAKNLIVDFTPEYDPSLCVDAMIQEDGSIYKLFNSRRRRIKSTDEVDLCKPEFAGISEDNAESVCDYWVDMLYPGGLEALSGFVPEFELFKPTCHPIAEYCSKTWRRVVNGYIAIHGDIRSEIVSVTLTCDGAVDFYINDITDQDYTQGEFNNREEILSNAARKVRYLIQQKSLWSSFNENDYDFANIEYIAPVLFRVQRELAVYCATSIAEIWNARKLDGKLVYCHLVQIPRKHDDAASELDDKHQGLLLILDSLSGQLVSIWVPPPPGTELKMVKDFMASKGSAD